MGIGLMDLRCIFATATSGLLWCAIIVSGARPAPLGHEPVKALPTLNASASHHVVPVSSPTPVHSEVSASKSVHHLAGTPFPNHPKAVVKSDAESLLKAKATPAPLHSPSNTTSLLHANGKLPNASHHGIHGKAIHTSEMQVSSKTERLKELEKSEHKHGHKHGHKLKHKVGHQKSEKAPGIIVYGQVAPTYIPKIGVANVTTATAMPPPPPTLNPTEDYQPMDTQIGDYILKQFEVPPTLTPPPLQSAISAAFACPLFILPGRVWVQAPSGCGGDRNGVWYDANRNVKLYWNESCVAFPNAVNADMKYTIPGNGDPMMGTSVTHLSWTKDVVEIYDCSAKALYTFSEKVYKRMNSVDEAACEAYGICDYELYFQFFITSATGATMASTAYLSYFQREITLVDPAMIPIATLQRKGNWSPKDKCPEYDMEWIVTFGGSASPLTAPPNRWIVVAFTTIMSMHDQDRNLQGFIEPSHCQKFSFTFLAASIVISTLVVIVLSILFWLFLKEPLRVMCFQLEELVFPRTQYKASKFDP